MWLADYLTLHGRTEPTSQHSLKPHVQEGVGVSTMFNGTTAISIVVPTYNEAASLSDLVCRLHTTMTEAAITYEVVIVDDGSPDGTGELAEQLAQNYPIRVVHRLAKSGLASAVIAGMDVAVSDILGVMDADLSHPPERVPSLVGALADPEVDLAIGSRYVIGGGTEDWPRLRWITSVIANLLTRGLTPVRDATSGFFVIRRRTLRNVILNPIGFKIGLEVIAKARYARCVEVPYVFTDRKRGRSKFGPAEVRHFLHQIILLYRDRVLSVCGRVRKS